MTVHYETRNAYQSNNCVQYTSFRNHENIRFHNQEDFSFNIVIFVTVRPYNLDCHTALLLLLVTRTLVYVAVDKGNF
jgi:hypothetical protein